MPVSDNPVLDTIFRMGPVNDETIAGELGDNVSTGDVFDRTEALAKVGLIEESEFAPGRWQITDEGRRRLGHGPG